jgi:RNA polymerase-binding transcription factor
VSRGFRDADDTQQLSGREADEAIRRLQSAGERQARRAAELRHQGSYGLCESCGKRIGDDRLAAVPEATRCIACQVSFEAGQSNS